MTDPCSAGRIIFMRVPDSTWPTQEHPCTEDGGHHHLTMVTPGPGRYQFVAPICFWHMTEFTAHFYRPEGPPPWET